MSGETSDARDGEAVRRETATDVSDERVADAGGESDERRTDRSSPDEASESLYVEELHVRRAPGFESESFRIDDLSPGVTVVHGPNASGKTTAARAIQWCCWPDAAPERAEVEGRFAIGEEDWRVLVDRGTATYQRDGRDADAPSLPPAEQRDRYRLALHDLLQRDVRDADLAAAIERESAGGYDLDAAHESLGFDDSPSTRGKREVTAAENAIGNWREAQADLRDVEQERDRLPELERELEAAHEAQRRVELLAQAVEYATARDELADAEAELEAFPDELERLDGDEYERVRELEAEIDEWETRREEAVEDRREAERELDAVALPDAGLPGGLLDRLEERVDRLETLEDRASQLERELAGARERRADAREAVPLDVDPADLDDLDADAWPALWAFARDADAVASERRLRETAERWLGDAAPPDADAETLRRGQRALESWLANAPAEGTDATDSGGPADDEGGVVPTDPAARVATVAAGVVAAVSVALAAIVDPLVLVLLPVAAGLFWYGRRVGAGDDADERRRTYREEFEQLALEPPAAWTRDAVRERLTELYDALADHELDRQRADTLATLLEERSALEERERALEERRERLRETLGAAPDATDLELVATAKALVRWQSCDEDVRAYEAKREAVRDEADDLRETVAADLAPYDRDGTYGDLDDAAAARACVDDLTDRARRHADAVELRERASEAIETAEAKLDALRDERDALFADAGLDAGDHDRLREYCERVDAYEDAVAAVERARSVAEKERSDLRDRPGHEPELEECDVATLREREQSAATTAEAYDELQQEISEVEARIDAAKHDHEVETARADAERALDDLEDLLAADAAAMVGDALVEHCRDATVEANRPAVFDRARDLLARITRGRYRLDLAQDGDAFRAFDAVRERGHALEELSSGTQLQVLLAVRLAFVEHQEHGRRLPLLLDETLANSDDERARVIVDAVVELARAGRQVLYFTAQGDEVAKWRDALADADVPYAEVDLAERRGLDDRVRVPDFDDAVSAAPSPPDPADHDHASYGDALDVPPFDPREGAGRAHCWYVVEDVDALATLLGLGVERWGQLETLFDRGLGHLVADDPDVRTAIERRGRALERFVECWRHGRGDRVTRDALEATGAVTENFLDDVTELARSLDGDARRILDALDAGEVDRFRSDKVDELEAYFEAEGYLDPAEPLGPDEVRVRVIATLVDEGIDREAAASEADALLSRLHRAGD